MRYGLVIFFVLSFSLIRGQYFHESLDLYSNLRSQLINEQKFKIGFKTYSILKYQNTVPNLLDNFHLASRFRFNRKQSWILRNTEFGVGFQAFFSGASQVPDVYNKPPVLVKVYEKEGNNNVFSPGVQVIRTLWFSDTTLWRLQVGLGLRYNYIGNERFFSKSYPFGYDLSLYLKYKVFSLQYQHSAHTIYSSYRYKIEDIGDAIESDKERVSIPDEFRNLSILTLAFGDDYLKKPTKEDKTLYNIYFTFRRDDFSNKDLRSDFSFKNLDYIIGFRINHAGLKINPEFSFTPRYNIDGYSYKCHNYSMLVGYELKQFEIMFGYSHVIYYPQAVDLHSLKEAEDIHCDRVVVSIGYYF